MTALARIRSTAVHQQRSGAASAASRRGSSSNSSSSNVFCISRSTSISLSSPTSNLRRRSSVAARAGAKPMPAWDGIYGYITERKLETVSPREAFELASKKGWVIVDVRPKRRHEQSAPDAGGNVVSVPLYDAPDFSKPSLVRYLRAALLASQGVPAVEQNEEFVDRILGLLGEEGRSGLLMLCEVGGSLTPTVSFPTGKTSRSLQAAFRALEAGVDATKVKHVAGGCFAYSQEEGLPMTAAYDAAGVGRTPGVVAEERQRR